MKTKITITLTAIFLTTSAFAQININQSKQTQTKIVEIDDQELFTAKTITQNVQTLRFEKADKGQLNQSLRDTPVMVSKTIWLDNDKDNRYDKALRLYYNREQNKELSYTVTREDIRITDDTASLSLVEEGVYTVHTSDIDGIIVSIDEVK